MDLQDFPVTKTPRIRGPASSTETSASVGENVQETSLSHIDKLEKWLRAQAALPKSPVGEAIGYTLNNIAAFKRHLSHSMIPNRMPYSP